MKEGDPLYDIYINWLKFRLNINEINKGTFEMMRISRAFFDYFIERYDKEEIFKQNQDHLYKSMNRDKVIKDILDGPCK